MQTGNFEDSETHQEESNDLGLPEMCKLCNLVMKYGAVNCTVPLKKTQFFTKYAASDVKARKLKRVKTNISNQDTVFTALASRSEKLPHFPATLRIFHVASLQGPKGRRTLRTTRRPIIMT